MLGRFINGDGYASTGQGFLGFNMFAYCINNPINCIDNSGNDAIWIQESGSAWSMGHTGLLVQDSNGKWYYFFWGAESGFDVLLSGQSKAHIECESIDDEGLDLTWQFNVQEVIRCSSNEFVSDRADKITEIIYFQGDYSATVDWLLNVYSNSKTIDYTYDLLYCNCVQVCCLALSQSNPRFNDVYGTIPNISAIKAHTISHYNHARQQYRGGSHATKPNIIHIAQ